MKTQTGSGKIGVYKKYITNVLQRQWTQGDNGVVKDYKNMTKHHI
jgi:hypothetical protein